MPSIIAKGGADFSLNAISFRAPVSSGLEGWWFTGGQAGDSSDAAIARATKNLAFNSYGAALHGAPTVNTGYTAFLTGQYLQTSIPENLDFTALCVVKNTDTIAGASTRPQFMGTTGATTGGTRLYIGTTGGTSGVTVTGQQFGSVSGSPIQLGPGAVASGARLSSGFDFLYHSSDHTTLQATVGDMTQNLSNTITIGNGPVVNSAGINWHAGDAPGDTGLADGAMNMAFMALYSRKLTSIEIASIYTFVQNYLNVKFSIAI